MFAAVLGSILAGITMQQASTALDGLLNAQTEAYAFARPNPGIHLSPSAGARYGMEQGCLPHVMTGRPARDFFDTAAISRGPRVEGQHTVTSAITLKEEANGACYDHCAAGRSGGTARRDVGGLQRGRRRE